MAALLAGACGARTGLSAGEPPQPRDGAADPVTPAARRMDGSMVVDAAGDSGHPDGAPVTDAADAGEARDATLDTGPVDACAGQRETLRRRRARVMFVIDRSQSMDQPIGGGSAMRRWDALRDAIEGALEGRAAKLAVGAKLYPSVVGGGSSIQCTVNAGVELAPGPGQAGDLIQLFNRTIGGSTPTAGAIAAARNYLVRRPREETASFLVLATDGAPNCNPNPPEPPSECLCTFPDDRDLCRDQPGFARLCLDDHRTVRAIEETFQQAGIPVYVVGIRDAAETSFTDTLDRMAVAGGRPRPASAETRYYRAGRQVELRQAFDAIASSIADCVFRLRRVDPVCVAEVRVGGEAVPHDPEQTDGWDFTDENAGEITLFGNACDRASDPSVQVTAGS